RREHVDREGVAEQDQEGVARAQLHHGGAGQVRELVVGAAPTDQRRPGGLTEGEPELDPGHGSHQRLVEILHGLDEVALAEDEVDILRLVDGDGGDLHGRLLTSRRDGPAGTARLRRSGGTLAPQGARAPAGDRKDGRRQWERGLGAAWGSRLVPTGSTAPYLSPHLARSHEQSARD